MASWKDDRLELALRASKEGVWDWHLEKNTIWYSRRILRFLGYRRSKVPNVFAERAAHMDAESAETVAEALRRVCQEGEDLFAVEAHIRTKTGQWKWFRVRGTPVRDGLGKVVRIVGSLIDISKRMAAEAALAEERSLIRTLMDSIPMNIYFKDVDSRFVMANLATAKKMGLNSPEEMVGKKDSDFFDREHAEHARAVEEEIMSTGKGFSDVTEHEIWEDREDTWVKTTKHVWQGRSGMVKGTFGVTSDITELMQTRANQERVGAELQVQNSRMEEERQRMRQVIDGVPMQVYFKNQDHRFVIVNYAMARWMGCEKPEELYDKRDRDFFSAEHWKQAEEDERRIMETGVPVIDQVEKETWSGKKDTWVMTSKYPWRDSEGVIFGTFGVSSDVSDLVIARQQLEAQAATLRKKNDDMAVELNLAREVQQALLPDRIPDFSGGGKVLKFTKLYRPALELAGDFFEVIQLDEGRVGFFICDVMGQGVRSALIVSMLRGLIEKQRKSTETPGKFLTGLNDGLGHLLLESGGGIRATAFYGVIDLEADEIQLAVAGHPNPIAVFEDGVRQLVPPDEARGPALGQKRGVIYGSVTAQLEGLRRLICFSDGVKKATNALGEQFGVSRVIETVERGGPLPRVLNQLTKSVLEFGGGPDEFGNAICLLAWEIES